MKAKELAEGIREACVRAVRDERESGVYLDRQRAACRGVRNLSREPYDAAEEAVLGLDLDEVLEKLEKNESVPQVSP